MQLQDLIDLSAKVFPFNAEAYPEIGSYSEDEQTSFAVSHQALHFAKTTGKIAGLAEEIDHATTGLTETRRYLLKDQATAQFINVLRLAETLGMGADDIMTMAANKLLTLEK
jgi:hypothetical protein